MCASHNICNRFAWKRIAGDTGGIAMYTDLEAKTAELDRANKLIAKVISHLKTNRVDYTRARLLRVQNDLSALISRVGEAQRLICMYLTEADRRPPRAAAARLPAPFETSLLQGIPEQDFQDIPEEISDIASNNPPANGELHLLKRFASNLQGAGAFWESLFGMRLRREPRARGVSL
ncbi:MAG TPA: hypothetical protein VIX59_17030 [Candidatus Binataceae bacterium]